MSRKNSPEINAGSMADIAFLLLIFFLVTTTMDVESGILRKIPEKIEENSKLDIKEKNILQVSLNFKNEVFVDNNLVKIDDLKQIGMDFIDNGGGFDVEGNPCDWCHGKKLSTSSDHPKKAIISIQSDRNTNYETYILVLDAFNSSYTYLRNKLSIKLHGKSYQALLDEFAKSNYSNKKVEQKIKIIREKYPLLLSDAEIK